MKSASSTRSGANSVNGGKDGSNSAALRRHAAISGTRRRAARSSTMAGSTAATAPTWSAAMSLSPAGSRTSSSAPAGTSIRTRSRRRWRLFPASGRNGVAVFGVPDRASGTERLVVLAETEETDLQREPACRPACMRLPAHRRRPARRSHPCTPGRCRRPRAARSAEPPQGSSISERTSRCHSARSGGSLRV